MVAPCSKIRRRGKEKPLSQQRGKKGSLSFLALGLLLEGMFLEGLILGLDGLSRLWVHLAKILLASCNSRGNPLLLGAGTLYM